MLDKETVIKTVGEYAKAVTMEFKPHSILIYGSYAKGNARQDSDIDVAVVFDGYNGEWLKDSSRLWRLTRDISDDIEPILLDTQNDPSGFVAEVLKTGQIIYQA